MNKDIYHRNEIFNKNRFLVEIKGNIYLFAPRNLPNNFRPKGAAMLDAILNFRKRNTVYEVPAGNKGTADPSRFASIATSCIVGE